MIQKFSLHHDRPLWMPFNEGEYADKVVKSPKKRQALGKFWQEICRRNIYEIVMERLYEIAEVKDLW
jgi:hypothetical protein